MAISAEQRRQWREEEKAKIKAMLNRALAMGPSAYRVSCRLLDSGDILTSARKASFASDHHGGSRADASLMVRKEPEAEAQWLKEARLAAEAEWHRAHGQPSPQRDMRTAEQVALDGQFGDIAMQAAGLTHNDDGRSAFAPIATMVRSTRRAKQAREGFSAIRGDHGNRFEHIDGS
jgi:hypothetical protein